MVRRKKIIHNLRLGMMAILMSLAFAISCNMTVFADDAVPTATLIANSNNTNKLAYVTYTEYELYFELNTADSTGGVTCSVSGIRSLSSSMNQTVTVPAAIAVDLDTGISNFTVVSVAADAFNGYIYASRFVLPNTVTSLGKNAFYGCTNLKYISLPDSISDIGTECFYGCVSLESSGDANYSGALKMPVNLEYVGAGAFGNCPKLTNLNASNCIYYRNIGDDGILYSIESASSYRLVQCPAGSPVKELTIPDSVFAIDPEAFIYCTGLTQVTMGDSVRSVRERAFYGCSSLKKVILPTDVTLSGEDIFGNCPALKSIVVHSSSTGNALSYCNANKYPVETHCTVKFYDGATLLDTQDVLYGGAAKAPTVQPKAGYTATWDTSFENVKTDLTVKLVWRQNYTVIFQDTAHGWKSTYDAYYGETLKPPVWTLDGYALSWDTDLYQYVTKDLTVNAVWLVSMTDTPIDKDTSDGVFDEVGDVFKVGIIKYQVTKFASGDKRVAVLSCTDKKAKKVVIPATVTAGGNSYKVTAIGKNVFKNMTKLKKAVIGKNVVMIGKKAFYGCSSLKKLVIKTRLLKADGIAIKSFGKVNGKCIVSVPSGYIEKYAVRLKDGGIPTSVRMKTIKS